jgi:hypothetical protein
MENYLTTLQTITDYYTNLLIIQYHDKPRAKATIALLTQLLYANMVLLQIRDGFNIDTAVGNQLDIIGKWLGVSRFYNGILLWYHDYFAAPDYEQIENDLYVAYQGGFSTYTDYNSLSGGMLTYDEWSNTQRSKNKMGDTLYRQLIKLKIIYNSINFTCKNIDDAIFEWSRGYVYTTWANRTVTYHYLNDYYYALEIAAYKQMLPVPLGCSYLLVERN